jgi:hypothetical protein
MAALALSIAGAAAGNAVFGPTGAIVGRLAGALAGNAIDQVLFGTRLERSVNGPRLADLEVWPRPKAQPSRAFMAPRLASQVIWATHLNKVARSLGTTGGGGGGGRAWADRRDHHHDLFLFRQSAVGREGIGAVQVWADGKPLD